MSVSRRIFYNTLAQSAGKIISVAIGLFTIALMTRFLGDAGFGQYTTVISFMGFFGILADLGLYLVTTREISREGADERKILGGVFALRFVTVIAVLVLGALLALFFPYSREVKLAMFVGIAAFTFVSGTQVLVGVFQKHLVFYKLTISEIVGRLVMLLGVFLAIRSGLALIYFVLALSAANGIHFFISLIIARRIVPFRLEFDFVFWKNILYKSWPLAFSVILNLIYFRADLLILSAFKPPEDVGVYGLSYKILEVLAAFPAMFAGLIMPFLSRFAFTDWKQYQNYLQKAFDALLLIVVPMITITLFFAKPILDLVGGTGFANADLVLKLLIFATAMIYLGNLLGYTVVALEIQRKMVWGYLAGSVVGLILYFVLIPRFSYFGAAAATIIVELLVLIYAYILTSKISRFYPSFAILLKAGLAAVPMLLFYLFISLPWALEAIIGFVIYALLLLLVRAIPLEFVKTLAFRE